MFEDDGNPNIFGMPLGADFAGCLAREVMSAYAERPPEELARVEIFVNTSRMRRSLTEAFQKGRALLLPRIRLVTEIVDVLSPDEGDEPKDDLRTKLELSQLVRALIERQVSRAPRAAVYDLSDSLSKLMDEMHGEGVLPDDVFALDVTDQSGHWQDSLEFIRILAPYFESQSGTTSRQRKATEYLLSEWETCPPDHPVIVAGSTASRGATRLFMKGVAKLAKGVIILPGYDFDQPADARMRLEDEDHPQFRLAAFLEEIDLHANDVRPWPNANAPCPARNRLVSLALRPAPVTKEWIAEGPKLGSLIEATENITLLEADSPRQEAEAIALRMRKSLDQGLKCALVTPDRMLTRQVAAALDRWNLVPDDSAGTPLLLSAPGRFLAQLVDWVGQTIPSHALLALLKHPLCNSSDGNRGDHLRWSRDLELHVRNRGLKSLTRTELSSWIEKEKKEDAEEWASWLADFLEANEHCHHSTLSDLFEAFLRLAEQFAAGPNDAGSGELWLEAAGREAKAICNRLAKSADAAGQIPKSDFPMILLGVLADGVVRDRDSGHPDLLILGTLEARVQSADLVILGGLNEGVWPEAPSPDPWLNRKMRKSVGLLLPERQIGLSAHDFQQAISAPVVWLTRSKRTADAETVPSRWVNRLLNLMEGLPQQSGPNAIKKMRAKGEAWKAWADSLSVPAGPAEPAKRPSPCPPPGARPKELSVTRIKTLIRDPFAIYAERILRLPQLNPLLMEADAPLRGVIFHKVLERFIRETDEVHFPESVDDLIRIATEELDADCPWPAIRLRWLTQFQALAPAFVADEVVRQSEGRVAGLELRGKATLSKTGITLKGVADRIDVNHEGYAKIYDYKTGVVPTIAQQEKFDKQLLLEAAMVSNGAFEKLDPLEVSSAEFISVKPDMKKTKAPIEKQPPDVVWQDLENLLVRWSQIETGYTARMAMVSKTDKSPYDHLSRFGEWTLSDLPRKEQLK